MKTTKTTIANPFLLTGYEGAEYFCDRREETQKIISALENGRNITLVSPRRMGKTGLIQHVFNTLAKNKQNICIYIDIYNTTSLAEFIHSLAEAVIGTADTKSQKIITKIFTFFKSLRPVIAANEHTGAPEFSIEVQPAKINESLKEIFQYLSKSEKTCYIAIDEFQQITQYKDSGVEALLRSHIQQLSNVHFVFSGSQRHVMENLFTSASRPFYQSTQMLQLAEIKQPEYIKFATKLFAKNGKKLPNHVAAWVYGMANGHTWYVQMIFNRLFSLNIAEYTIETVQNTINEIISENEVTFQTYCKLITDKQFALLRAIAAETSVTSPTANAFINKHNLGAASSVAVAIKSLMEKELLFDDNGKICVYDRFFSLWLKKQFDTKTT